MPLRAHESGDATRYDCSLERLPWYHVRVPADRPTAETQVMSFVRRLCTLVLLAAGVVGCQRGQSVTPMGDAARMDPDFTGSAAGEEREVGGIKVCWCPAGRFLMG